MQDLKLALAVGQLGRKWVKVAEFMGGGVTRDMCFDRWRRHVDPRVAAKKKPKGPWNPEKVLSSVPGLALSLRTQLTTNKIAISSSINIPGMCICFCLNRMTDCALLFKRSVVIGFVCRSMWGVGLLPTSAACTGITW
jgi:Myb-like DNA-binding domain